MTLLIATPDTHAAERDYSLGVILGEFLGLPWRRVRSADAAVRLRLSDAQGEIELPDHFFSRLGEHAWLTPDTLPQLPLPTWDSRAPATDRHIRLPIDVFGAARSRPAPWSVATSIVLLRILCGQPKVKVSPRKNTEKHGKQQ